MLPLRNPPLLAIEDLCVEFATRRGAVTAVRSVNLAIARGETLGIVGESPPDRPRQRSFELRRGVRGAVFARPRLRSAPGPFAYSTPPIRVSTTATLEPKSSQ